MRSITVLAIVGMFLVYAVLELRPETDFITAIGGVTLFLSTIYTAIKTHLNEIELKKVINVSEETHKSVNSRLDAMIAAQKSISRQEGLAEGERLGRKKSNAETATLADELYTRENPGE